MVQVRNVVRFHGLALALALVATMVHGQEAELISADRRGFAAEGESRSGVISGDGRWVAFASNAIDLLPERNDRLPFRDVFVRDRATGAVERISVRAGAGPTGPDAEPNGDSQPGSLNAPAISADGCRVAFSSHATDMLPEDSAPTDSGRFEDVFVRDRCAGETIRISVGAGGEEADGNSTDPDLSNDGRWVVFHSQASNLVDGDENGVADVFLHDLESGVTEIVSRTSAGDAATGGDSVTAAISGNGRVVVFASRATNLAAAANGRAQIYLRDRDSQETILVSRNAGNQAGNDHSFCPDASRDGSVIAYKSDASNLVAGDTNGVADTFAFDRATGTTVRVSVDDFGQQARALSAHPAVSDDGRFVAFPAFDDFLDPDDGNRQSDIYIVDREGPVGDRIARVTVPARPPVDAGVGEAAPDLSGDGKWVVFASPSSRFLPVDQDNNNAFDVFVTCNPFDESCPVECLADEQCAEGERCDETGACVPEPTITPTSPPTPTPTDTTAPTLPPTEPPTATATDTVPPGTPTPTPTLTRTPRLCSSDEDCPENERCDLEQGVCVPIDCTDDEDCPLGQTCDPETMTCMLVPCTGDQDCPPPSICDEDAGICIPRDCADDDDCPPGQSCDPDDMICIHTPCEDDGDCPRDSICDPGQGICVPIPCDEDRDCPPGQMCDPDGDFCVPTPCDDDRDCPPASVCDADQDKCVPIPCADDGDCPAGSSCDPDDMICVAKPCDTDEQCPSDAICDPTTGLCTPRPPCESNDDCPPAEVCDTDTGECVVPTATPTRRGGGGGCAVNPERRGNLPGALALLLPLLALLRTRRRRTDVKPAL